MKRPVRIRLLLALGLVISGVHPMLAQRHRVAFTCDSLVPDRWIRPVNVASTEKIPTVLSAQLAFLHGQGFLEASIDTCITDSTSTTCPIVLGKPYRWATLSGKGIAKEISSESRFREKLYSGRPIAPRSVERLLEDLLRRSENHGYPFARAWLDSITHTEVGLSAEVNLKLGRLVRFDSVVVRGSAKTNMRYLQSHIGVRPGDLYNEALVRGVERRIRELPFVTQRQRPYVQFTTEHTKLFLFLDGKKASSVNGILGLQPDPLSGKVALTGDLDLRLRNALKRGEAIDLNWRSLANKTQDLKVRFNLPFAFNTPFGTDASLKLFKQDSTFLEITARGALEYLLSRGDKLSLVVNSKTSDRLGRNTINLIGLADVKVLSYGLALERERFDYRFNPRSGHSVLLEGSVGNKRTTTAVLGQAEQPPTIRTVQYELNSKAVAHIPIRRRSTIRVVGQGGWMVNNNLYRNELYRIGGLKTLRGQDEASIYASAYAIGTLEYRFVYEENANFFLFVDQGWWEDNAQATLVTDTPRGFGLGTTFETKAGLFSLTYALGQQFDSPVVLRGGKVHFGFTSLF